MLSKYNILNLLGYNKFSIVYLIYRINIKIIKNYLDTKI